MEEYVFVARESARQPVLDLLLVLWIASMAFSKADVRLCVERGPGGGRPRVRCVSIAVQFLEGFLARDAARLHTSDGGPEAALVLFAEAIAAFHRVGNVPQLIITLASVPALFERLERQRPRPCSSARCLGSRRASTTSRARRPRRSLEREAGRVASYGAESAGAGLDHDAAVYASQQIDAARRDPTRGRRRGPGGLPTEDPRCFAS